MHKITLSSGAELSNLTLNGNNYIAEGIVDDAVFVGNLSTVTISDGQESATYSDMKLVQHIVVDGQSWFVLAEKTAEEKRQEELLQLIADLAEVVLLGGGQ